MTTQRPKHLVVRISEREHEELRRAAELAGLPFSDWVRRRLSEAAAQVLSEHSTREGDA